MEHKFLHLIIAPLVQQPKCELTANEHSMYIIFLCFRGIIQDFHTFTAQATGFNIQHCIYFGKIFLLYFTLISGANGMKLFSYVNYICMQYARVIAPGKPFQLSPRFVSKDRELTWVKHLSTALFFGSLMILPKNIRPGWKCLSETNTIANYEHL